MASPSSSLATLRPDISGSFTEFDLEQNINGFVWDQLMPVFDVASASGTFGIIPIEQLLQSRDTLRAPGSGYNRGKFTFTTGSYATREHGAEEPVDDNEAAMFREYFDAEVIAALRARHAVLANAEARVINALLANANTANATVKWDLPATAKPIDNVEVAVNAIYDRTGVWPDTIGMSRKTFRLLRNVDQIRDRIESTGAGSPTKATDITVQMLAAVFDIPKIVIAGSSRNTANAGQPAALGQIWDQTKVIVCKTAGGNDFREPCIGRTFHWSADGSSVSGTVESYRDETVRGDIVRVRHQVEEKILYPEMGQIIAAVI